MQAEQRYGARFRMLSSTTASGTRYGVYCLSSWTLQALSAQQVAFHIPVWETGKGLLMQFALYYVP